MYIVLYLNISFLILGQSNIYSCDSVLGSPMLRRSSSEWRGGSGGAGATEYCGCGQEEEGEKPGARDRDSHAGDTGGVTTHIMGDGDINSEVVT